MTILVTGATGFVGKALISRLLMDHYSVLALVRRNGVKLKAGVKSIVSDLSGLDGLGTNVLDGVDVVVHCAARAHVMSDDSAECYFEYSKVNRDATLTLASMAAEANVKRFVFVSSIKVNGESTQTNHPFKPEVGSAPIDPYGLSKYEAERGLMKIAKETGMEVVIVRPPLVYGPGVKGNFASMVKWIKKGVPLPLGAIHNQRSLVALDNVVDFVALCADPQKSPKAANEVFLISDGEDVSIAELLKKIAKAQNKRAWLLPIPTGIIKFVAKLLGKGGVADRLVGNLQVDSSKAKSLLGWEPVITMDEQLANMFKREVR